MICKYLVKYAKNDVVHYMNSWGFLEEHHHVNLFCFFSLTLFSSALTIVLLDMRFDLIGFD